MKIILSNSKQYEGDINTSIVNIDGIKTNKLDITLSNEYIIDDIKNDFKNQENISVIEIKNNSDLNAMNPFVSYSFYSITETNDGTIIVSLIKDNVSAKIDNLDKQIVEIQEQISDQGMTDDEKELVKSIISIAKIQAVSLSDSDALKVRNLYKKWDEDPVGYSYSLKNEDDLRRQYNDKLWKLQKNHDKQLDWYPGSDPTLWSEVVEGYDGTLDNPIPVPESVTTSGFEYEYGKYYLENGKVYLAKRQGKQNGEKEKLYFAPSSLIGQYFELIS